MRATSHSKLDLFIERVSRRASIIYPSGCQDFEDYIQVGYLALLKARRGHKNADSDCFEKYARVSIFRAIRYAAIQSTSAFSAPHSIKVLAAKIRAKLDTTCENNICRELDITPQVWDQLKCLVKFPSQDVELSETYPCYSCFDDICSLLNIREKLILLDVLGEISVDIYRLSKNKTIAKIQKKMIKGGYANGS